MKRLNLTFSMVLVTVLLFTGRAFAEDYVIAQKNTGLLLDTTHWRPAAGQVVQLYARGADGKPTPSQMWVVDEYQRTPKGICYTITHKNSGLLLDTTHWEPAAGQVVRVYPRGADGKPTPSQLWEVKQLADGSYSIRRWLSDKYLDTTYWKPSPGQVVKMYLADRGMPTQSQRWYLQRY